MTNDLEATIIVGARRLRLTGTHAAYMQMLQDWLADKSAIAAAIRDLPRGSLCLDVGAHIGLTAITVASLRPDCHVIAFEPLPAAQVCLRHNLEANGIKNVDIVQAAVGDSPGTITFDDKGPWSVAGSGSVSCKVVRLDDLPIVKPAFIKIDVEGFEPNVFDGARRLLSEAKPLMLVEFNSWTLLLHHYDPLTFAGAIWSNFDVLQMFQDERPLPPSPDPTAFVHTNLTQHGCVTDLLLRPKGEIPSLHAMIDTPQAARLRQRQMATP